MREGGRGEGGRGGEREREREREREHQVITGSTDTCMFFDIIITRLTDLEVKL